MIQIPEAVCVGCAEEFRINKNGVTLHVMVKDTNRHYYSIDSDQWECPRCGVKILVGFAKQPYVYGFETKGKKPEPSQPYTPEVTIER